MTISFEHILFLLVVFISNTIQTLTGFAGTMLGMPPAILLIGATQAKAVLCMVGLLNCLYLAIQNHKKVDKKEFWKITWWMLGGMLVGIYLFQLIELKVLLILYAILIIVISLVKLFVKKPIAWPPKWSFMIILMSGLVHGMFVSGGSLLVIYAASAIKDKSVFRATLSPVWVVLNSILMVMYWKEGLLHGEVWGLTLISIVPLGVAIYLGNKIHHKISTALFLKISYVLLLLSGVLLLVGGK